MTFLIGFLLALVIASAARLLRALTPAGAVAAALLGTIVFGFGGWQAALLLITFFVSSSLMGRINRSRRSATEPRYAKGSERDAGQVVGNGLMAGILAVAMSANSGSAWPWLAYAGAVAAVNADTWATELGALSIHAPRLITNLKRAGPAGTSGGVSTMGTLAAASGAALIGALAGFFGPRSDARWIAPIAIAGLAAAMLDSLLGATVQSMFRCSRDGMETEQHPVHRCGAPTVHVRGWLWLNNDRVNLVCSLAGALLAVGTGALMGLV